jgi:hypothetical protein
MIDPGSRNATNAGLYHYTSCTNQTQERSSHVEIVFHDVAVNCSGQPIE